MSADTVILVRCFIVSNYYAESQQLKWSFILWWGHLKMQWNQYSVQVQRNYLLSIADINSVKNTNCALAYTSGFISRALI